MCTPRVGIPGVGITLSKPPPESGRGREAVDRGGGRRGLRREIIRSFFLRPIHLGRSPSLPVTSDILTLAGSSLKRELRVERSSAQFRGVEWWQPGAVCLLCHGERAVS